MSGPVLLFLAFPPSSFLLSARAREGGEEASKQGKSRKKVSADSRSGDWRRGALHRVRARGTRLRRNHARMHPEGALEKCLRSTPSASRGDPDPPGATQPWPGRTFALRGGLRPRRLPDSCAGVPMRPPALGVCLQCPPVVFVTRMNVRRSECARGEGRFLEKCLPDTTEA